MLFRHFPEDQLKKVLVQMLLIRILLIQYPGKISVEAAVKYVVVVYDDFVKNRDQHLELLNMLRK